MAKLKVRVSPRSSRSGLVSDGGGVKAYLHSPPADGRANDELIDLVAKSLGLRKSDLLLARGQKSRDKEIEIVGLEQRALDALVSNLPQS